MLKLLYVYFSEFLATLILTGQVAMATSSVKQKIVNFPPVIDGRINVVKFLEASSYLVSVVDRLGTIFAPVKYDMQGNIDIIQKNFVYDAKSCLLELMLDEIAKGKPVATESVLWLNRALLFFELAFQELLKHLRSNNQNINIKKIFTVAYEGSVKKYHKWVTQQLFMIICKMSPTLPQIMKSFELDEDMKEFESIITNYSITLHLIRCKIDDFFNDNNVFKVKSGDTQF